MKLRQLTTIDEYRCVYELEHSVWGYTSSEDAVPVPMIIVTQKIGGLLLGAFDEGDQLVGFAYSLPGVKDGRPFQWSHMLGVAPSQRDRGLGWQLKLEQRRLTLDLGMDLIEWTYDPLQALNAHLNFAKLGIVVREYHENVYGESSSPLHRGTATDRFIAEWWIRSPRVEERLRAAGAGQAATGGRTDAAPVNEVRTAGAWIAPVRHDLLVDADLLAVTIPTGFTELQQQDAPLAQDWRSSTREIFSHYFGRGYEVVDFVLDRPNRRGTYLLRPRPVA